MKKDLRQFFSFLLLTIILFTGCLPYVSKVTDYEEIPSMLNVLTNNIQSAVDQGYFEKGEQAVLEYVSEKNPNILNWFKENKYELKVGVVDDYAIVMVCDKGKPIFEDTFCEPGSPDKDHRDNPNLKSCKITMTSEEVRNFCK